MTSQYSGSNAEPSGSAATQDWFFRRAAIATNAPKQTPRNEHIFGIPYSIRRAIVPGTHAVQTTIVLRDFSGGGGVLQGPFSAFPNRYWQSNAVDATFPGYLLSSQQILNDQTSSGTNVGVHGLNIFGTLIEGVGSTNDLCLFQETSATDPTMIAIAGVGTAGRPGASITGLYPIIIGGATTALQMMECLVGAKPLLVTNAAGTLNAGVLDAAWNPTWWVCQTSLPGNPIIHQSGNTIFNSLTAASTIAAVPTGSTALTGTVRAGGYLIGEHELTNSPPRVWFVEPKANNTAGMLLAGSETLGYVESVNLEGTDLQRLNFATFPNGIYMALWCQSPSGPGILASDGKRVAFHDGAKETNLRFFEQIPSVRSAVLGPITSGAAILCGGLATKGGDIFAVAYTSGVFANNWKYDWASGVWNTISATMQGSVPTFPGYNGNPVSFNTGFVHQNFGTANIRQFLTTSDENPYILYRRTSGAGAATGNQFETGISTVGLVSPIWSLDGLEGHPSVVEGIDFGGDVWAGNTGAQVYVAVYNQNVLAAGDLERSLSNTGSVSTYFSAQDPPGMEVEFPDNKSFFYNFQVQISPIVTGGIRYAVNCLPIYIHLLTFLDDVVMSPGEVRALEAAAHVPPQQRR